MATSDITITLSSEAKGRLVSAYCRIDGRPIGKVLESGLSIPQMVNDMQHQALARLNAKGEIPEALIIDAEAEATKAEAARAAIAPIPAGR
jgi:hypothetical protein